jgi:hypothetical protein
MGQNLMQFNSIDAPNLFNCGEGTVASISVFEYKAGAEHSNAIAARWFGREWPESKRDRLIETIPDEAGLSDRWWRGILLKINIRRRSGQVFAEKHRYRRRLGIVLAVFAVGETFQHVY